MAKSKIAGITIEIGGDTTGLQQALSKVNKKITDTQAELKDLNSALKLDPGNTELLEQKQRKLAEAVQATTEKLKTLKEAQKQAADQLERGEISQAQYDALTREIVKTEAALKDAKKASEGFNASLEEAKASLEIVGNKANAVADATRKVSAAAAGVVAGIVGVGAAAVKGADELNTLSQQSGVATDELQKWEYASGVVDVSVETMTGALAKMTKQLGSSSGEEKIRALGVATRDASGQLRDSEEVFYDLLEALGRVQNGTERDVLAMEIFGKSANELAGIIDDGGAALKALGDEAEQLGIIMDQETLDSLNRVDDAIEKLKAQAKGEFAKAGAAAIEALTPVLDKLIEQISALLSWIGQLDPVTLQIILTVAAVIAAISPVAGLIAKITMAINGVLTVLPLLGGALGVLEAVTIVGLIAAIAALVITIVQNWDEIKATLTEAWDKVKEFFSKIKEAINDFVEKVRSFFGAARDSVVEIWTNITDAIKERVNMILGYVNTVIEGINAMTSVVNGSKIGQALGINIGQISTIPELQTSRSAGASMTTNNYTTTNFNTSSQPMQVNVQLDSQTMARALVSPMSQQMALAGGSSIY